MYNIDLYLVVHHLCSVCSFHLSTLQDKLCLDVALLSGSDYHDLCLFSMDDDFVFFTAFRYFVKFLGLNSFVFVKSHYIL